MLIVLLFVEHQLTPPSAEVLAMPVSDQQSYMLQIIRNVAQHAPAQFYAFLPDAIATVQRAPVSSLTQRVEQITQRLGACRPTRNGAGPEPAVPQQKG